MKDIATRPPLDGKDLDAAIDHARAALAALLRIPGGGDGASYPKMLAEARALIGALLDRRVALAAARMDERDADAVAAARADRNEAIAVTGALLYWLPADDAAWPKVALTLGRLSYDRYTDPWPGAEPPDPDDLDAACDLLLRGARYDDADERTTLYLFLALRDRQHLMACPKDARALMTWGERLLAFPDAGGLGRSGLQDMLELELLDRVESLSRAGSWGPWGLRPLRLAGTLIQRVCPTQNSMNVALILVGSMEHWAGSGRLDGTLGRLAAPPGSMWDLDNTPLLGRVSHSLVTAACWTLPISRRTGSRRHTHGPARPGRLAPGGRRLCPWTCSAASG